MQLHGLAAIVTGGSSGLGAATAQMLAKKGANVSIFDINGEAAKEAAKLFGGIAYSCDISKSDEVEAMIKMAEDKYGIARILVNCAGVGPAQKVLGRSGTMTMEEFEQTIRINLSGSFNVLRLFAERVSTAKALSTEERGVIINTASVAAYEGQIGQVSYAASKGGIVSMTLPLAREFAPLGIRVNAIAPGAFETSMTQSLPQRARESLGVATPFPARMGRPEEYAQLVEAILENPMINGETIRIDGAIRLAPK